MIPVRPKKHLGQHFLHDHNIARKITGSLSDQAKNVLEIGPGTGILTKYLIENEDLNLKLIEIDQDSVAFLHEQYPTLQNNIIQADFLQSDLSEIFHGSFSIIGNFPYNISSQIFFKTLQYRGQIEEVVGMVQKEVAERIAASPSNKTFGILSVLLQTWFDIKYLFTVNESVFIPPPKVKSAVIRLTRNQRQQLECDEELFMRVVKAAFNQRRKTLRNSLSGLIESKNTTNLLFMDKRAEQLSPTDFIDLTCAIQKQADSPV